MRPSSNRSHRIGPVIAVAIALVVVAGATCGIAGATPRKARLPENSVGARQLKAGAVTAKKLRLQSLAPVLQLRISDSCSAGGAIASVHQDGSVECVPPTGPPSGPAGGALSGAYPDPFLNVTGGPCENGRALTSISSNAVLTCAIGVYADASANLGVSSQPFEGVAGGRDNSAFGLKALASVVDGSANSAFGRGALENNTDGSKNLAAGGFALGSNISGGQNSALGNSALASNLSGEFNTAVGFLSLSSNTTGDDNVAVGNRALYSNTVAGGNSAFGDSALSLVTSGGQNVAVGQNALLASTTAGRNTATGAAALMANSTGSENTAAGHSALLGNTTGKNNVAVGFQAGESLTTGDDNIDIGANVSGVPGESNTIRIGDQEVQNATYLAGVSGTNLGAQPAVVVNGEGRLGVETSSRRFKTDIQPIGAPLERLMALRPISFRYKPDAVHAVGRLQFGLLAEQVARIYPNLVVRGGNGRPYSILYQELPALLLAQVQRQQRQIERQQRQIDLLMRRVGG